MASDGSSGVKQRRRGGGDASVGDAGVGGTSSVVAGAGGIDGAEQRRHGRGGGVFF
jgi:hypothetical protein